MPLMARWLSWLERRPVTAEVTGSSPAGVATKLLTNVRSFFVLLPYFVV